MSDFIPKKSKIFEFWNIFEKFGVGLIFDDESTCQ